MTTLINYLWEVKSTNTHTLTLTLTLTLHAKQDYPSTAGLAFIWRNGRSEPHLILSSVVILMSSSPGGHHIFILTTFDTEMPHYCTHRKLVMLMHVAVEELGWCEHRASLAKLQCCRAEVKNLGHVLREGQWLLSPVRLQLLLLLSGVQQWPRPSLYYKDNSLEPCSNKVSCSSSSPELWVGGEDECDRQRELMKMRTLTRVQNGFTEGPSSSKDKEIKISFKYISLKISKAAVHTCRSSISSEDPFPAVCKVKVIQAWIEQRALS